MSETLGITILPDGTSKSIVIPNNQIMKRLGRPVVSSAFLRREGLMGADVFLAYNQDNYVSLFDPKFEEQEYIVAVENSKQRIVEIARVSATVLSVIGYNERYLIFVLSNGPGRYTFARSRAGPFTIQTTAGPNSVVDDIYSNSNAPKPLL